MNKFFYIIKIIDSCKLYEHLNICKKLISSYKEPEGQKLLFYKWEEKLNQIQNFIN